MNEVKAVVRDENEYIAQQHFAISLLTPYQYAFYQPWLKGYNGQALSVPTVTGYANLGYFYESRFWIDHN